MILVCGIPTESPVAMVYDALVSLNVPTLVFNQRQFAKTHMQVSMEQGQLIGWLALEGKTYSLDKIQGVYTRLMNEQYLPELRSLSVQAPQRVQCQQLHYTLQQWLEVTPARVLNRTAAMGSNFSKPYQAQLITRYGFKTPVTLITNNPEEVQQFQRQYQKIIYKSISGIRSIVQELTPSDLVRLDQIRWCPTQFQAYVAGINVRVHVIGEQVFATKINSQATDYRYAHSQGYEAELEAVELDGDLAQQCINLAQDLDLPFAGIDLNITPDDEVYCFEVNPSPGFSYFEQNTGQPIALAVARYLAGLT